MENSHIGWTTSTFNPWWGCTKVSQGCKFCYAETQSARFGNDIWGPTANRKPMSESYWKQPEKWDREAAAAGVRIRVFCASMADVFEGPETCQNPEAYRVVREARYRLFDLIRTTPNLTWQLLTKRPENILRFIKECAQFAAGHPPDKTEDGEARNLQLTSWLHLWSIGIAPKNVHMGTSIESQDVIGRVEHLIKVPAYVRFLSVEPMLGPVDLFHMDEESRALRGPGVIISGGVTPSTPDSAPEGYDDSYPGIQWVICGGESGPNARPMHPEWAKGLRDQCVAAGVPFFFKQWGRYGPNAPIDKNERYDYSRSVCVSYDGNLFLPGETAYPNGPRYAEACRANNGQPRLHMMHDLGKSKTGRLLADETLNERTWDEFPEVIL